MSMEYSIGEIAAMTGAQTPEGAADLRVSGVSTDTRTLERGNLFVALSGEHFDGDTFVDTAFEKGAAAAITHRPHEAGPCLVHPEPLKALQQLATRHREQCAAAIIAITGSCGKTTVKDMTAAVLGTRYPVVKTPGNLNNDIGCPLSLLRIAPETRYAIIEMGANHPGEIAELCRMARPIESTVTLVAPAHLEGFGGSVAAVAKAKSEIMEALPPDGCFYVNADDPYCREMADRYPGEKVFFGSRGDVVLDDLHFDAAGEMALTISPVGRMRLPLSVRAHAANVLLAIAIGLRHGITAFEEPLRAACLSASRFRVIKLGSRTVLDDTYNANPASMRAALEALADYPGARKIAVLGDMFEVGDEAPSLHAGVGAEAARQGVYRLMALGAHAPDLVAGARDAGLVQAAAFESHEAVAAALRADAAPGDVLLVKGSRGMRMETVIQLLQAVSTGDV